MGPLSKRQSAAVLTVATVGTAAVTVKTARHSDPWRGAGMGTVALDLLGGLVAFQLRPTRERYGASSLRSRLTFALVHIQPFAVPALNQGSWKQAAFRYTASVISTAALETALPRANSRRLAATALGTGLSALDLALGDSPQRWFGPVYFMKVVAGHGGMPRE